MPIHPDLPSSSSLVALQAVGVELSTHSLANRQETRRSKQPASEGGCKGSLSELGSRSKDLEDRHSRSLGRLSEAVGDFPVLLGLTRQVCKMIWPEGLNTFCGVRTGRMGH